LSPVTSVIVFSSFHETEVHDFCHVGRAAPLGHQDDVGRLDIAVNQANAVCLRERRGHLPQNVDDAGGELRAVESHEILEVQTFQVLHCVVKHSVRCPTVIEDRHRIGMGQPTGELYFTFESFEAYGARLCRGQQFHSCRATQHGMGCAVHGAHPSFSNLFEQRVLAQLRRLAYLLPEAEDDL
jgi:hypothetical protein